jgi:hypothetical protein
MQGRRLAGMKECNQAGKQASIRASKQTKSEQEIKQ